MSLQELQPTTATQATNDATRIDPATQVGLVSLTIADLDRSIAYYTEMLGFTLLERAGATATLGAPETPLLLLMELPGARRWPQDQYGYTGLYHFAIVVPTRADLGRWLRHWLELGNPLPGQGDHLVSEALYLTDPDGNGIEVYRDRPRSEWTWVGGQVRMATDPVDIRGVLLEAEREGQPWAGFPVGTRLGHMHLQVGNIPQAATFYRDVLGFDIVAQMPTALFVSAGGYHHHIGMNIWHSRNAQPAPAGMAGLRVFTLELPTQAARDAVLARAQAAGVAYTQEGEVVRIDDPFHNTILLTIGAVADAAEVNALRGATAV